MSKMARPKIVWSPRREYALTKTPFHFNGQEMKWGLILRSHSFKNDSPIISANIPIAKVRRQ